MPDTASELDVPSYLAATRTLFALLRTGLSLSGAGALATSWLARAWPSWVIASVSAGFMLLGVSLSWVAIRKQVRLRRLYRGHGAELLFPYWYVAAMCVAAQALIGLLVVLYVVSLVRGGPVLSSSGR